jgi:hypothetical protein
MEWSRARVAGGAVAVLGVVLLLAVVALASRPGAGTGAPLLSADPARLVIDVTFYLLVVLLLLVLVVVVWALWPRPDDEPLQLPPRRRWALSTVMTALLAIGVAIWLRAGGHLARPSFLGAGGGGGAGRPAALGAPVRAAGQAGFDWFAAAIVAVLLAGAAVLAWWLLLRPRRRTPGQRALARLLAVLDDAIEDVLGEADPRRAVIAAWTRLERVLSRHGVPRHDSEAPFEYAARAGAAIGVEAVSLERLADLFEWARFSLHEVTPAMRQEALDGLLAVRDGLRLVA